MRRIRIAGLVLAAVFAVSALAAASSTAAEPEYLSCGKASGKTGHYMNKACSEVSAKSEGKYERTALTVPDKFKAKSGATGLFLYNPMTKETLIEVPCAKDKDEGEIINTREAKLKITYEGCVIPEGRALKGDCTSEGQKKAGTIVTDALVSRLVWTNEAETEVGIELEPATPGGPFTKFGCANMAEEVEVLGSEVGKITPVNEASKTLTTSFNVGSFGQPEFGGLYEGGTMTTVTELANLSGFVAHPDVPFSEKSVEPQKGGVALVTG